MIPVWRRDTGADAIVAQGMEAGGRRAGFDAADAERALVGLFALVPAVVGAVSVPVVATGGIADGRGVAAALALGAGAVQIGTGFLRCPEAQIHPAWADAIGGAAPEGTTLSRVFSGRPGRSLATPYLRDASSEQALSPAPQSRPAWADSGDAVSGGFLGRHRAHAGMGGAVSGPGVG